MFLRGKKTLTYILIALGIAALLWQLALLRPDNGTSTTFALVAPAFAAELDAVPLAPAVEKIQEEAGISAYINSGQPVTLSQVRSVFRTIEIETSQYIIGSVPIADHTEWEDAHVYVSTDGWVMAYYWDGDPVSKIINWKDYRNSGHTQLSTKLEGALNTVAGAAGIGVSSVSYYDFRYPNANRMMLIGEKNSNGNNFSVNIPSTFGVSERSYALDGCTGRLYLDGAQLQAICGTGYGVITAAQLLPDIDHWVEVNDVGGIALIYREP